VTREVNLCQRVLHPFFKSIDVKYYVSENPDIKMGMVERFNRTLKERMWRYFTHNTTRRYIDVLQKIISAYNHSYHRIIKMRPIEVNEKNIYDVWKT
jgi:hypothetical protein